MSQENVDLARKMIEWFNTGDMAAAQAHSTDDVEIVPMRAAMEGTSYRGPGAFAAFGSATEEAWEEIRFKPEALHDGGEQVVVIGELSARGRGTGAAVSARTALLFEFRGGRLQRGKSYSDIEKALEAAGLQA